MGLNDSFDEVRNQILMQEPLPNVKKTYAMLQNVESQRMVHKDLEDVSKHSTMMVKTQSFGKGNSKCSKKRRDMERKDDKHCDHCKMQGHTRESCFKLNGYPEWYVELMKNRKEKKFGKQLNMVEALSNQEKQQE